MSSSSPAPPSSPQGHVKTLPCTPTHPVHEGQQPQVVCPSQHHGLDKLRTEQRILLADLSAGQHQVQEQGISGVHAPIVAGEHLGQPGVAPGLQAAGHLLTGLAVLVPLRVQVTPDFLQKQQRQD